MVDSFAVREGLPLMVLIPLAKSERCFPKPVGSELFGMQYLAFLVFGMSLPLLSRPITDCELCSMPLVVKRVGCHHS